MPQPETACPWAVAVDPFDASDHIHPSEFDLLDRVIELVVKSGSFARPLLGAALQLSDRKVARLTAELEDLGVITRGNDDDRRKVLVEPGELAAFLVGVRSNRRSLTAA